MKKVKKADEGFTLIEVLVAVVIFSFGLLGIAGLMTISVRNNNNGYLRSQANFLVENMVDRMRANPVALWAGAYDGDAVSGGQACTLSSPCDYGALAAFDMQRWADSIAIAMPPGAVGNIACQNATVTDSFKVPNAAWTAVSTYDGVCTVSVTWDESDGGHDPNPQSVVLVVQP